MKFNRKTLTKKILLGLILGSFALTSPFASFAVKLGNNTSTSNDQDVAIGNGAQTINSSSNGVAIGEATVVDLNGSTAYWGGIAIGGRWNSRYGVGSKYDKDGLGVGTSTFADSTIVLGVDSHIESKGLNSIVIGQAVTTNSPKSIAIGDKTAVSDNSMALGVSAKATGTNSVALGTGTETTENDVVAVGNRRLTQLADGTADTDATTLGQVKSLITDNSADKDLSNISNNGLKKIKETASSAITVSGDKHLTVTKTTNDEDGTSDIALAIKDNGVVEKNNEDLVTGGAVYDSMHQDNVSMGTNSEASGDHSIAIGGESVETGGDGSTVKTPTTASGSYALALGAGATASETETVAVGAGSEATGESSVAIGSGALSQGANSIALGAGSEAKEADTVSVGSDDLKRRITNVADAVNDDDAATLKQVKEAVSKGVDFGNLTEANNKALKDNIRETVTVTDGVHTKAVSKEDGKGNISYSVNVETSGMVASGNADIVTGGAVYDYISQNIADRNLSNLTPDGKKQIRLAANDGLSIFGDSRLTVTSSTDTDGNTSYNLKVNATGKATKGNTGLIDGNTLYESIKDIPTSAAMENKASVDMDNISSKGQDRIFNIAKDSVKVIDGDNTTVTKGVDDNGSITYKVHATANGKIEAKDTNAISGDTAKKALDKKADADASNLTDDDIHAWQDALSDGAKVQKNNTNLLTGNDVYDYLHQQEISFGANSTALNGSIAIGGEFVDGSERTPTSATGKYGVALGSGSTSSGDYSTALGAGAIASGADSVSIGSNTVNNEDSTVAIGNRRLTQVADAVKDTDAVNYGQMKDAIAKGNNFKDLSEDNKSDLKDIIKDTVKVTGGEYNTVTSTTDEDGNLSYKVDTKVDGKIEEGNTGLVTGGDIHDYVKDNTVNKDLSNISDEAKDTIKKLAGSSVDIKTDDHLTAEKSFDENGNTTISIGVKADGKAEKGNQGLITGDTLYDALKDLPTGAAMEGKANTNLDNISAKGEEKIKDIAKDSIKLIDGDNTTVIEGTDSNGNKTYQIHAEANGKLEEGNTDAVSGDTVKKALDEKADLDGSNLTGHEKEWADKLGVGKIEQGNQYLVTGDTVFNGVTEIVKENSLVKSDGSTITVAKNDTATKIDFSGTNGDRVLTGIKTDANDASSAANVGYVNQATEGLYRDMNSMKSELRGEINDATAKAGAIAALHPQDYDPEDKLDFAAGYGTYKGSNAAALGVFYRPNENTTLNIGATVGAGEPLVTAGVSLKLGKGSGEIKSRNGMAKEIKDLKSRNSDLEEEVAYLEDQMHMVMQQLSNLSVNGQIKKDAVPTSPQKEHAKKAMKKLQEKKIVQGYPDGKMKPQKKMTRYEYAQMLYNALRAGKKVNYEQLREFTPELKEIRQQDTQEASK